MTTDKSSVELISKIEEKIKNVQTQSLDISFNELLDMHKNKELNISPDYQRLFQWSEGARSRFIESLLLEMPVPPIFVIEEEDGKYLLIDGLQRISSYLHLRGELKAEHLVPPVKKGEKLELVDCDIVEELNGKTFDDLGTALQIRLKRAFVRVEVIRKGSNPLLKYYMFKRLNNGGQLLTPQQIRNCTIRLLDKRFNDFIIDLSKTDDFMTCIDPIGNNRFISAFDQELVLRFFAIKNFKEKYKGYLGDFLTEYMEAVSDADRKKKPIFVYDAERECFNKTFKILSDAMGAMAFSFSDLKGKRLTRGFSTNNYEAITVGLQPLLDRIDANDKGMIKKIETAIYAMKQEAEYIAITSGGGKNSQKDLDQRIQYVTNKIEEVL